MTKACDDEFITVDSVLNSGHRALGVDAFSLALLRAERQIRKIFTYLVFQSPSFKGSDIDALRQTLSQNSRIYFHHFEQGIEELADISVEVMIGKEYANLKKRIEEAIEARGKIFHGQLTSNSMDRSTLLDLEHDIRDWCKKLADGALKNIGYDGFIPDSFQKDTSKSGIETVVSKKIKTVNDYKTFLEALSPPRKKKP